MPDPARRIEPLPSIAAIEAAAWDGLHDGSNPFIRHAFLAALERHRCIRPEWGWRAHHIGIFHGAQLVAAAPCYLKMNSRGEYVFDWHWADAWENAGGTYYPKLLAAVPWSPVTGPRLLASDAPEAPALRAALAAAMVEETARLGLSSAHVNFLREIERDAFDEAWLPRSDWQFHWQNQGYRDFEDFLASLTHKKRKNIRQERRQAQSAAVCSMQTGASLDADEWRRIDALYRHTFDEKGNFAALDLGFFIELAQTFGDALVLALARRDDEIVAMALFLRGTDTLYGRYWGASEEIPAMHFELCYYQGIDYAIRHGLARFEPGAQGVHKIARGFLPARVDSMHYIRDLRFRAAVRRALEHEATMLDAQHAALMAHSPYRTP